MRRRHVGDRAAVQVGLRDRVRRVQVIDSPGSRLASWLPTVLTAGQVTVALSSVTVTGPASDTLPLFVTR